MHQHHAFYTLRLMFDGNIQLHDTPCYGQRVSLLCTRSRLQD